MSSTERVRQGKSSGHSDLRKTQRTGTRAMPAKAGSRRKAVSLCPSRPDQPRMSENPARQMFESSVPMEMDDGQGMGTGHQGCGCFVVGETLGANGVEA